MIIAAGVALVSSLIAAGQEGEAAAVRKSIADKIGAEHLPEFEKALAQEIESSAFSGIKEDDGLRNTQVNALRGLEEEYASGGNSEADMAANQLAGDAVQQQAASASANLGQSLANRGIRNSGLAAALSTQIQQNAGNQLGNMAQQNAVAARLRAMQALEASLSGAGGVRNQDYRKSSDVARAQDELNRFNAVQRTNATNANNQWAQQGFNNAMNRNAAEANAVNGVASGYERQAAGTRATGAGVANAAIDWGTGEQDAEEKKNRKG